MAQNVLEDNRDKLDTIAHRLIEVETLDAKQFMAFFGDGDDDDPTIIPGTPPSLRESRERPANAERDRPAPTLDSPPSPAPA